MVILDNCTAHTGIDPASLPEFCHIIFLPPNPTSKHQPADMGMISALKLGYKSRMLSVLLDIVDDEAKFLAARTGAKYAGRGKKGLPFACDPHILDAMLLCNAVWNHKDDYARFSSRASVIRCWRKAGILFQGECADLNNEAGSRVESKLTEDELTQLSKNMIELQLKATSLSPGASSLLPPSIADSFVSEGTLNCSAAKEMCQVWVDVESDAAVVDVEVDEAISHLEENTTTNEPTIEPESENDDDDDPPPLPAPSRLELLNAFNIITAHCNAKCSGTTMPDSVARLRRSIESHDLKERILKTNSQQLSISSFFTRRI